MKVNGRATRTIWLNADGSSVDVIDQRWLPHEFRVATLTTLGEAATAIRDMWVRGAPLIGVTAAYGVALAMRDDPNDANLDAAWERLHATRPTAINLRWALDAVRNRLLLLEPAARAAAAYALAAEIADEDVAINRAIGRNGLAAHPQQSPPRSRRARRSTSSPIATPAGSRRSTAAPRRRRSTWRMEAGIPVHVYVDETRPRNQGASLTAWELGQPRRAAHADRRQRRRPLMQHGLVDMVIVGTDRTTARGDVCNKIGTYLKALAAQGQRRAVLCRAAVADHRLDGRDGVREIPIEERSADEVDTIQGLGADGKVARVRISPAGSPAANPAFDVTPARLVTGLITERGVAASSREGLKALFPERG